MIRGDAVSAKPWQLRMFEVSLKKKQKVRLLLELLGPLAEQRCLLVTCGDNSGAMNFQFRAAGGRWSWADMEATGVEAIEELLGEPVWFVAPDRLPYEDGAFDRVVVVDVHEHLDDCSALNREIARVLAPRGVAVVTTPNGETGLPFARLKRWIGMHPADYGHVVQGYRSDELQRMLGAQGLEFQRAGAYSRFFTELSELAINFAYVRILSRRSSGNGVTSGEIAPTSAEKLKRVERSYRAYSRIYPLVRAFSALDRIVPGSGGYAVAVAARKPG
jgi:SAM-dependent methyltransferase